MNVLNSQTKQPQVQLKNEETPRHQRPDVRILGQEQKQKQNHELPTMKYVNQSGLANSQISQYSRESQQNQQKQEYQQQQQYKVIDKNVQATNNLKLDYQRECETFQKKLQNDYQNQLNQLKTNIENDYQQKLEQLKIEVNLKISNENKNISKDFNQLHQKNEKQIKEINDKLKQQDQIVNKLKGQLEQNHIQYIQQFDQHTTQQSSKLNEMQNDLKKQIVQNLASNTSDLESIKQNLLNLTNKQQEQQKDLTQLIEYKNEKSEQIEQSIKINCQNSFTQYTQEFNQQLGFIKSKIPQIQQEQNVLSQQVKQDSKKNEENLKNLKHQIAQITEVQNELKLDYQNSTKQIQLLITKLSQDYQNLKSDYINQNQCLKQNKLEVLQVVQKTTESFQKDLETLQIKLQAIIDNNENKLSKQLNKFQQQTLSMENQLMKRCQSLKDLTNNQLKEIETIKENFENYKNQSIENQKEATEKLEQYIVDSNNGSQILVLALTQQQTQLQEYIDRQNQEYAQLQQIDGQLKKHIESIEYRIQPSNNELKKKIDSQEEIFDILTKQWLKQFEQLEEKILNKILDQNKIIKKIYKNHEQQMTMTTQNSFNTQSIVKQTEKFPPLHSSNIEVILECQHSYAEDCLIQFILTQLSNFQIPQCNDCKKPIRTYLLQKLDNSQELLQKTYQIQLSEIKKKSTISECKKCQFFWISEQAKSFMECELCK